MFPGLREMALPVIPLSVSSRFEELAGCMQVVRAHLVSTASRGVPTRIGWRDPATTLYEHFRPRTAGEGGCFEPSCLVA